MKKIPNEVKIGILSAVTIVLFILGLNYLKGTSLFSKTKYYKAAFSDVNYLLSGNKVFFNGLVVGQVRAAEYNPETKKNDLTFDIDSKVQVPIDSKVVIFAYDMLGTMALKVILGSSSTIADNYAILKDSIQVGMVDKLTNELMPVKDKMTLALGDIDSLAKSIRHLIEDSSSYRIKTMLTNFQTMSHNLANSTAGLKGTLSKVDSIAGNAQVLTATLAGNKDKMDKIFKNVANLSDSLAQSPLPSTIKTAEITLSELKLLLKEMNEGKGTVGKIMKTDSIHNQVVKVTNSLDALLIEFKEHPKRFVHFSLFGKKEKALKEEKTKSLK